MFHKGYCALFLFSLLFKISYTLLFLCCLQASVAKSEALTEANRQEEFQGEVVNIDNYIQEIETTISESETATNLTSVKAQYTRHKVC